MRTAILVSAPVAPDVVERMRAGLAPQQDFLALAEALDATLIAPNRPGRRQRRLSPAWDAWRAASAAFRERRAYDLIISDGEAAGLLLSLLFRMFRVKRRHILVGYGRATHRGPDAAVRALGLLKRVDLVVCYGRVNAERYVRILGFPPQRVAVVPHATDHRFWRPLPVEPEDLVCSAVGQEYQDYPTLIEAVRGADVRVEVAGSKPWQWTGRDADAYPPNVRFARYRPSELRDLYARALFVAVPLRGERGGQAGSRVVYEAMDMGKAVVVTRTPGQVGLGLVREGETGLLVPTGDVAVWRSALSFFRAHPDEARRMGANARRAVEEGLNLERWVGEVAALAQSLGGRTGERVGPSSLPQSIARAGHDAESPSESR